MKQHEWEQFAPVAEECVHCWIKRTVLPSSGRYIYYTTPDSDIYNEEPDCIERPDKEAAKDES